MDITSLRRHDVDPLSAVAERERGVNLKLIEPHDLSHVSVESKRAAQGDCSQWTKLPLSIIRVV